MRSAIRVPGPELEYLAVHLCCFGRTVPAEQGPRAEEAVAHVARSQGHGSAEMLGRRFQIPTLELGLTQAGPGGRCSGGALEDTPEEYRCLVQLVLSEASLGFSQQIWFSAFLVGACRATGRRGVSARG